MRTLSLYRLRSPLSSMSIMDTYELQLFMLLWEDNIKWVPDKKASQDALVKMHVQLMYSVGGTVRGMTISLDVAAEVAAIEVGQGEKDDGERVGDTKGGAGQEKDDGATKGKRRRRRKAKGMRGSGGLSVIQ